MEFGVDFIGMRFLAGPVGPDKAYDASYSPALVLVSYGFAVFGAYVGLVISQHVAAVRRRAAKAAWIAAGAVAMGGGVWSMHFIGMLAYSLPFEVGYDLPLTILSVTPAIAASAVALAILSRKQVGVGALLIGGVLTGAGIGTMHFLGMAAVRADASMGYDPVLFILSIVVAVVLACLALSEKFRLEALHSRFALKWSNAIGAALMGLAIAGMHYTAMAAATFYPGDLCAIPGYVIKKDLLAVLVNVFSFMIIALVLMAAVAQKVLASSSLLASVFEYSIEGLVVTDGSGTITLFSPAAERIFGYAAHEALGRNVALLMPPALADQHDGFMAQYRGPVGSSFVGRNREMTAVRKDGSEIPIEIGVADISVGRERIFSATIRDITRQRQAEAATRRAHDELAESLKKQIELNKTQAEFVSMVSHEFRTPLAIIDMTAQRLLRAKGGPSADDLATRTQKIRDAVKRMTGLMESMLSTATMTAGELRIVKAPCNLRDLVESACARQREISRQHRFAVDAAALPAEIMLDAAAIDQVLTNLLSNAVKYAPDAPDIEVRGWQENGEAFIAVTDHGLGIDEEDLPRMFERYFRAKSALGIGGTGLGLHLSKHIAWRHDGRITVDSERGAGSTFTLRLPIRARDAEASAA
jgi:PAS domain S-box-containing protein